MLLIDKPVGVSSFRVVSCVRKQFNIKRVGHAGTLDPLASGLLIVLVGREETSEQDSFMRLPKAYEVTIELGKHSTTDDREGQLIDLHAAELTRLEFEQQLTKFIGDIQQVPPQFSAAHVNGERAYKLARQQQTVELKPRTVTISKIDITAFSWPMVSLRVQCGHGTYIRSLARDLGGYVTELRRTQIGHYHVADAISLDQLETAQNQPLKLE